MSPPRSTFSLAQLLLLVMLTGLLCAWLPRAAKWQYQTRVFRGQSAVSTDGKRFITYVDQYGPEYPPGGFAVYETETGRRLLSRSIGLLSFIHFDEHLRTIYVVKITSDRTTYGLTIYDIDRGVVREVAPPLSATKYFVSPLAISNRGEVVDHRYLPGDVASKNPWATVGLRTWDSQTGKIVKEFDWDGKSHVDFAQWSSAGHIFLICSQARSGKVLPNFTAWIRKDGTRHRSEIPPHGSSGAMLLCLNSRGNLAIVFQSHERLHEPITGKHSLLLANADTGGLEDLGSTTAWEIAQGAMTADDRYFYAAGSTTMFSKPVFFRFDLKTKEQTDIPLPEELSVHDFKLIEDDRRIAIAGDKGTLTVVDAQSGKIVRQMQGLGYYPWPIEWYVLGISAAVWCVLWWLATRQKKDERQDLGRLVVYAIFVFGLSIGLLLLGYRHELYWKPLLWRVVVTFALPSLSGVLGLAGLFLRRCNKLAAIYALLASIGILGYLIWHYVQSS